MNNYLMGNLFSELSLTSIAIARINIFLHGIEDLKFLMIFSPGFKAFFYHKPYGARLPELAIYF